MFAPHPQAFSVVAKTNTPEPTLPILRPTTLQFISLNFENEESLTIELYTPKETSLNEVSSIAEVSARTKKFNIAKHVTELAKQALLNNLIINIPHVYIIPWHNFTSRNLPSTICQARTIVMVRINHFIQISPGIFL